jgi:leucyl aminopeptidase (aminopeptidase T)
MELMKYVKIPIDLNCKPGQKALIVTDDAMDPNVWQAVAAYCYSIDVEPVVSMMITRPSHQAEPPDMIMEAMKTADVNFLVTSKALLHTKACMAAIALGKRYVLLEEASYDILTGAAVKADYQAIEKIGKRVQAALTKGENIRVKTPGGTDLTAVIKGRRAWLVGGKSYPEDNQYVSAFPDGECPIMPVEGTGNGVVVWDISCHYPKGLLKNPIKIKVENGIAKEIYGGDEAQALKNYIEEFGDANSYNCPAEIAIGLNPKATPRGVVREDKKLLGAVHVALGSSDVIDGKCHSKLHLDGLMAKPTVEVDGKVIVKDGVIVI